MAKNAFADVSTGKPVATEEDQEHLNYPEDSASTGKLVAPWYHGYQGTPGTPRDSGDSETGGNDEDWPHHLHTPPNYVQHIEKVFSIVRQTFGLRPTDQMKNIDVNTAVWGIFMSVTLQAAVHLGTKNQPKKSLRQLFQVTERSTTDQTEITGLTTIDWQQPMWRDDSVNWQSCTSFLSQCCVSEASVLNQSKHGKARLNGFWRHVISKIWIGSTGSRWSSSGKFHRIQYIMSSRRDSKYDDWIKVWIRASQRKDHLHVIV